MVDLGATYAINARLVAADGVEVGEFATTASLTAGQNTFILSFPWASIRAAGIDGPYVVEDLSIYPLSDSDELGYLVTAHRTAAYDADGLAESITLVTLRAMLAQEAESGGVARGISNSLDAKLNAGEAALALGQADVARSNIEAFRSELWAQRGKKVTEAAYLRLDGGAARLLTRL